MRSRSLAIAALGAGSALLGAQSPTVASRRAFTPADWYKVTTLSAPAVSPDGRHVAFTVTTVREAENKRHAEVWVVPAAGGDPVRFTSPSTESTNPRFSADGKYLLFTSTRPAGKGRTWALRMDVPGGEAFELDHPNGSTPRTGAFAVWSDSTTPDSTADSTARAKDLFASMQPMARPPYGAVTRPADAKRFDGRHIVDMRYKGNGIGFIPGGREKRAYRPSQIWMQRFDGSKKRMIDSTVYSRRNAVVSPDGKWIAFAADPALRPDSVVLAERDSLARLPYDPARDEAMRNESDIFVIAVGGGAPRRVTTFLGDEQGIAWSPDGRRLAFVAAPGRTKSDRIYTVDVAGGEPTNVLGDWTYEPAGVEWLAGGDMLFSASVGGRSALFRLSGKGGAPREVIGGRRRLTGFAYDSARSMVAFISTSVDKPTELLVASIDGRNERKLTNFNDSLNAAIAWSGAERFTYPSVGGLEIEGWLMKPYGYEPGKKYPLVLYIHGGPHSQYNEGWFDEFQNLAGAGMWVLYTNPRGSSGYGADFTYATRGRWFAEDYQDLMKAVDIAARRPDVDSTRMGVSGGSYGGVMAAWITTQTHRFKASQNDRMIANWWSWYGTSDAQGLTEFEFFGKPWDNPALYDTLSPIRYLRNVRTPTLIVQSEEDHRTPMTDAEQWFIGLKKHGVPVELVRYPRSASGRTRRPPVSPRREGVSSTTVTAIVSTLNEAERIAPCLDGLRAEGVPLLEVLVVDSRSTDGTREIVERVAASDPRFRLLTDEPLPAGWVGKVWALRHGLRAARGEWILGIDADVSAAPGMIAGAVHAATEGNYSVVSFSPRFAGQTNAELFLQPALLVTLVYRGGVAGADPDPDRVLANGQCFLARRDVLERHGGYDSARASFADDVTLARHLAQRGARVGFLDGSRLYAVRSYRSAPEMWREWGRSVDLSDATTPVRQWLDIIFLLLVQALPMIVVAAILVSRDGEPISATTRLLLGVNAALLVIRLLLLPALAGSYGRPRWPFWFSWLADPVAVARIIISTVRPRRTWRGREY